MSGFRFTYKHRKTSILVAVLAIVAGLYSFKFLGSEFLPELNEGSIWVRATLPYSISLDSSVTRSTQMRAIMMKFPQVKRVMTQTGRPDDGTDVAGFYNNADSYTHLRAHETRHELVCRLLLEKK